MLGRQYVSRAGVAGAMCHLLQVPSMEGGWVPFKGNSRKMGGCPSMDGGAEVGGWVLHGV